jgi:hypothetical protein
MKMVGNNKVFAGGVPTDIDVQKIVDEIGVPKEDQMIEYSALEKILGIRKESYRWRTVVNAWRRRLEREHNVLFRAVMNEGYRALAPSGRVDIAGSTFKGALRRIGRAATIASGTDRERLTDEEKRVVDHVQNTGAALRLAASQAARKMKSVSQWSEEAK